MNLKRQIKWVKSISVVLLAASTLSLPGILGAEDFSRKLNQDNHLEITSVSGFKTDAGITLAADKYESNFNNGFYNFYDQLDDNQKAVYYAMLDKLNPRTKNLEIPLVKNITYKSDQQDQIGVELSRIIQGAFDAFFKDCPEFFWVDIPNTNISYEYTLSGNTYTVTKITIHPAILPVYSPADNAVKAISRVQQEVANFPVQGSTRMEKLKSIHDELARRVRYDYSADRSASSYDAYGALVDGLAVCEGYSEAFKLICDRIGIPCILVIGDAVTSEGLGPHMWNAVLMDDGKWYFIDVTWDDQNDGELGRIVYSCFLVGTNSPGGVFGKLKFGESHLISGFFSKSGISKEFAYPQFAEGKYIPAGNATVPTDSPNQTVKPPAPLPETTAQIVASTAPATSKTAAKTTGKKTDKTDAAKSSRDAASTSAKIAESTTVASNISGLTNDNGNVSTTNPMTSASGDENSTANTDAGNGMVFILVAAALVGTGIIVAIIIASVLKSRKAD